MTAPTLYLTNAASRRPPFRGPGRVLTIMAAPRPAYGEAGEGDVFALVPRDLVLMRRALYALRKGEPEARAVHMYRRDYAAQLDERVASLPPGKLMADVRGRARPVPVADGDTLICACSREAAREGRCHRVWAAHALARAGWRVVLDGELLEAP